MSKANSQSQPNTESETQQSLTFLQMVSSILSSFLGVQSAKNRERDFVHGKARAFILVGIFMTMVWYGAIALIVHLVLRN